MHIISDHISAHKSRTAISINIYVIILENKQCQFKEVYNQKK